MGVLNWMHTKLHGSHRGRRKSEFRTGSARQLLELTLALPGLAVVDASAGLPQIDSLNDGWTTAMLSIGTFGMREGHRLKSSGRFDEPSKVQEELKSLVRARGAATADELSSVHHLQLERILSRSSSSKNGGIVRQRSLRKLATRTFGGLLHRPSFRETVPEMRFNEIVWGLLLKYAHPENPVLSDTATKDDRAVHQMTRKGKAEVGDEGCKWIRTDSECKFI
ncbi:hypothetical protein BS78_01G460300 [Paspalum vaginatum]|nr:hypothetical protein BS78_01G460300 [Paspalum vaginatum]